MFGVNLISIREFRLHGTCLEGCVNAQVCRIRRTSRRRVVASLTGYAGWPADAESVVISNRAQAIRIAILWLMNSPASMIEPLSGSSAVGGLPS